jgi:alkaline phosphatase D
MKKHLIFNLVLYALAACFLISCKDKRHEVIYDFDRIPDRIWVGEDFWTIPLEDWKVSAGRIECVSTYQQASMSLLSYVMKEESGDFKISIDMGLLAEGTNHGAAGLSIGVKDDTDDDIRAAIYFGSGLNLGVSTAGYTFLGHQVKELPNDFDYSDFNIEATGDYQSGSYEITMVLSDRTGNVIHESSLNTDTSLGGVIQLVNNFRTIDSRENGPNFWFDNLQLKGSKIRHTPGYSFGPVLWTMHTLSRDVLKMTAQLPPLGEQDNKSVNLELFINNEWVLAGAEQLDPDARTATFRLDGWDSSKDTPYRVVMDFVNTKGKQEVAEYAGAIRKDPVDRPVRMGALTCQFSNGFPYSPLVQNLELKEPDILYFSGDQIYERNGGYGIKRSPEDLAILNYLGKWYMFGWAFGDLMRNIPTICTPDDHDVYHGNLWGEGGVPFDDQDIINYRNNINTSDLRGFAQTVRFVNMVNRTQCAHLPDQYDPTPIEQGMSVWYTGLHYGRISFAIVTDRIFKSAPERVSQWNGRHDHITKPLDDPSVIEKPGLELLGHQQEVFLDEWIRDWNDVDMKVLLSQTVFANVATHHGNYDGYLFGDMDSGGWPKIARDRTLRSIRRAFAFHIAGDQHLSSLVQYGVDDYRDAGWSYCTPAIAIIYSRWFRPDDLNIPVFDRPDHNLPNTGKYEDSFGNKNYVYAIGNPENFSRNVNRYEFEQDKSAGFGMVYFDQSSRDIHIESWRFLADVMNPGPEDQHPGWPLTINQFDNYGREAVAWLPALNIKGNANPVVEVINETTKETEYIVRIIGNTFNPKVFSNGVYSIRTGYPETDTWKIMEGVQSVSANDSAVLDVSF